ncbi:MAG: hypothetical protein ACLT64_05185 [Streptococcus salivarius]
MTKTKLSLWGHSQFAATVLKGLIDSNNMKFSRSAQLTVRLVGKTELRMTPVKELALTVNLPVLQPENFQAQ